MYLFIFLLHLSIFICLLAYLFMYLFIRSPVHFSTSFVYFYLSFSLFIYVSIYLFTCLFFYFFICLFLFVR